MDASLASDIAEALRSNSAALSIFEALPPSHKREYLDWIDEAKRDETRRRRIAGMIDRLTGSPKRLIERTGSGRRGQSVGQKTASPKRLAERTGSGPRGQSVGQE